MLSTEDSFHVSAKLSTEKSFLYTPCYLLKMASMCACKLHYLSKIACMYSPCYEDTLLSIEDSFYVHTLLSIEDGFHV